MIANFRPCHFFIIGAMKAGTTTLHDDLSRHPDIFLPTLKEPGYYVGPQFGGPTHLPKRAATRKDYIRLFEAAKPHQLRGESSTYYSQAGIHDGVPERILNDCGPQTKFIYMMRDPVERAISHYKHDFQRGYCKAPTLADAIDTYRPLTLFSRYKYQLDQYLNYFPAENILTVRSEDYFLNRSACLDAILRFLDRRLTVRSEIDHERKLNSAESRRAFSPLARTLRSSSVYHRYVKPVLPQSIISVAKEALSTSPPNVEIGGDLDTLRDCISDRIPEADKALYKNNSIMS